MNDPGHRRETLGNSPFIRNSCVVSLQPRLRIMSVPAPGPVRVNERSQSLGKAACMSRNEPETTPNSDDRLCLGHLWFDRDKGELRDAGGNLVDLRNQSIEVLAALAARPMETVRKDDLIAAVWPDVAVTDDSLVQCIGDIRRALGSAGRNCIQTVRRRGYRLVPTDPRSKADTVVETSAWRKSRGVAVSFTVAALLVLGVALYAAFRVYGTSATTVHPDRPVIVVLPFKNINQDPGQEYFIDGLTEDITTDLSRVSGLFMISSASSFALRDSDATPDEMARELGADYYLTGSVRRDARRVRVTASLNERASGEIVWADRYDRDIGGIFDLQDDVSRSVVSALAIQLPADEQVQFEQAQTIDPEAYELVLRGLAPLRTFTESGILEAREYFQRAIRVDPGYARAHANLALTYGTSILFRLGDMPAEQEAALEHAELAVSLDPRLPQAQFALAVVLLSRQRHDQAIAAAREAIRLDPNYADGYAVLAQTLAFGGDKTDALASIRMAKARSPRYTFSYLWVEGHILFQLRRYDQARKLLEEVVARNPAMFLGNLTLAATYGHLGLMDEADWIALELMAVAPDISAFEEGRSLPYRNEEDRAHYVEGLLLAGLPE